jgi:RNA polymerase sigma-70 factor (sigma-E family)
MSSDAGTRVSGTRRPLSVSVRVVDDLHVELSSWSGSDEWFDDFYRDQWAAMVRLAYVLVGEQAVAEDLVQDAFARVFRARHRVKDASPYVRSAVYNACRNHLRSSARRRRRVTGTVTADAPVGDHVVDVVRRLPVRQRSLVVLRYYEGLTDAEIATTTGMPLGTVKSTLHRALTTLRKELS